jgi:hypothetical protein
MHDIQTALAPLGKPYTITRSRLGAITKVMEERYVCDLPSLKELATSISEKLASVPSQTKKLLSSRS